MKKIFLTAIVLSFITSSCIGQDKNAAKSPSLIIEGGVTTPLPDDSNKADEPKTDKAMNSIYDFKVTDIDGKTFDFASLKGKKIMIVNTASKCGFTPQYADLEKLYNKFQDRNFVIIGFPANNFGEQEPGNDEEIHAFCKRNYGVTFPMMSKISVKGEDMADIYKFLTKEKLNGFKSSEVQWNFQKYLIDEKGNLVDVLLSKVSPTDPIIVNWIQGK
ncbi:glutathione peroxidase [Flavobacterium sp. 3HN19-14]|uniref:glutathione peroxidase n=1 Tax=Flavobacterium sp. 3HN19-14 TaxID=3448133 RepID=UPI003EDF5332